MKKKFLTVLLSFVMAMLLLSVALATGDDRAEPVFVTRSEQALSLENIPAGATAYAAIYDSDNRMLRAELVETESGSVAWEEADVQVKVFLLNSQMQPISPAWSENRYTVGGNYETTVEGVVFDEDVVITGTNGSIIFSNCTFNGKLTNRGGEGAVARLIECSFGEDAECIIDANLNHPTFETAVTKFMIFGGEMPDVQCRGDGAVVALPDQTICLNGEEYPCSAADSYMVDEGPEYVDYDDALHGGLVSVHNVCIWDEDKGEEKKKIHVAIHGHDYQSNGDGTHTCICGTQICSYGEDGTCGACGGSRVDGVTRYVVDGTEVNGVTFDEDVVITGTNGNITFTNCIFNGKLTNRGGEGAVARLIECSFGEDAECIIDANLNHPTFETAVTKFMIFGGEMPDVQCRGDGAVVALPDQTICLNGEEYPCSAADSYMVDEGPEYVDYDDALHGGLVSVHNVCIWDEDKGEEKKKIHVAIGES